MGLGGGRKGDLDGAAPGASRKTGLSRLVARSFTRSTEAFPDIAIVDSEEALDHTAELGDGGRQRETGGRGGRRRRQQ